MRPVRPGGGEVVGGGQGRNGGAAPTARLEGVSGPRSHEGVLRPGALLCCPSRESSGALWREEGAPHREGRRAGTGRSTELQGTVQRPPGELRGARDAGEAAAAPSSTTISWRWSEARDRSRISCSR